MHIEDTALPGVRILTPKIFRDNRGYFSETWRNTVGLGSDVKFIQTNVSNSHPFVLRGLHYQVKKPQGKLVTCLRGSIYDVAVDIRKNSTTFGKWVGVHLDDKEHRAIYVPPGFAHGFLAGPTGAMVMYQCTTLFVEEDSRAIRWNDPDLDIKWPLGKGIGSTFDPVLSAKDIGATLFKDADYL